MSDLTNRPAITNQDLEDARSARLSVIVGRVFGIGIGVALLAVLASDLIAYQHLSLPILGFGTLLAASAALQFGGVWLAQHRQLAWGARVIVGGILVAIATIQVVWAYAFSIDAIVIALFAANVIPIGLGSVLGNARLMAVVTGLANLSAVFIALVLPHWVDPAFGGAQAWLSFAIVITVDWIIAGLVYGSSTLYGQALDELGALRLAIDRARQLDDMKDQFIAHVNHELRTPIMTLQGYLDYLHDARAGMSEAEIEAIFAQSGRSINRLVALLSSILDVRNIDQNNASLSLGPVVVSDVVVAARELVDPRQTRAITLIQTEAVRVWGDALSLQQILTNLLANAIKYSPPDAPIEVRAQVLNTTQPKGNRPGRRAQQRPLVEIAVRDHGLGIPPEQIPLLFHRFARLPRDLASNIPGSGLGLFLCQTLAENMGGEIGVTSHGIAGEGSTFWVRLPLASDGG